MIKINKGELEIDGEFQEVLAELSSGFAFVAKQTDRSVVIPAFLSSFYMLQAEKEGAGILGAIDMFREDTKKALEWIDAYTNMPGKDLSEKYKNVKGENSNE